jgi:CRISPR-associated protein Csa2
LPIKEEGQRRRDTLFVSIAARFLANIEALNAVESVGNVTKHRRAPVVVFDEKAGGYIIKYVPAISGESLGHAYQANVAEFARSLYKEGKVPLCKWCARGEFFKEMSRDYMIEEVKKVVEGVKGASREEQEERKHEFERIIIEKCLIEDIGGFLSAEVFPVKRTSAFQASYIIPTLDTLEATVIDTQFHTRHAPVVAGVEQEERPEEKTLEKRAGEREVRRAQMIYYVEVASAIYGLYMNLDLEAIGRTRLVRVEDAVTSEERKRRILAALGGLALTVLGQFGAKRSRFHPVSELKSVLLSISKPQPFSVTPPHTTAYIKFTAERASSFAELLKSIGAQFEAKLLAYDIERSERVTGVQYFSNVESLFKEAINYVLGAL